MKISPKKNADIGLKITGKAVNNVIKPAQGKTIANFEKLKQSMAKSASNLNGNPVREKTWYFNNKPFTERLLGIFFFVLVFQVMLSATSIFAAEIRGQTPKDG